MSKYTLEVVKHKVAFGSGSEYSIRKDGGDFMEACDRQSAEEVLPILNNHDALVEALRCSKNRLESIKETSPEYHLDDDIAQAEELLKQIKGE
jgi:hypothetical protein